MFPVAIVGSLELAPISAGQVPDVVRALMTALNSARASDVSSAENKVKFRAGVFRLVSNSNVLVPVGSGEIEVHFGSPGRVRYRFSCVQMLVIVSVMALLLACLIPTTESSPLRIGAPVAVWLFLFGINYVIALRRLPAFIRGVVCKAVA
jgi:hypothetical protein